MSEQAATALSLQLNLVRDLLDRPTTLPPKQQRQARNVAQDLGDRCWLNIGWHASKSRGELTGKASTATLQAEMGDLIELLQSKAKQKRRRGRPSKKGMTSFIDGLLVAPAMEARGGKPKATIVSELIGLGLLQKRAPGSHERRIRRQKDK